MAVGFAMYVLFTTATLFHFSGIDRWIQTYNCEHSVSEAGTPKFSQVSFSSSHYGIKRYVMNIILITSAHEHAGILVVHDSSTV